MTPVHSCFRSLFVLAVFLTALAPGPCLSEEQPADEAPVVTVATLWDYMPYCFWIDGAEKQAVETIPPGTDSSQLQGFSWDVVRESLHTMGYTIRLIVAPWERAMSYVRQGKADVLFPTALTEERRKTLIYSREMVNGAEYLIYVPPESDIEWTGIESLRGLRVAVIRGWSYGEAWSKENGILKEPSDRILQCFQMLDRGRVHGVAGYDVVFDYVLKKEGLAGRYRKLPAFDRNKEYLAGGRTNSRAPKILEDFDAGKRRIMENGVYRAIEARWR